MIMPTDRKKIIQLSVVAGAFLASGIVLYNGLFKNKSNDAAYQASQNVLGPAGQPGAAMVASGAPAGQSQIILPPGDLNFNAVLNDRAIKKRKLNFGLVDYPELDPSQEVGIPESELIKPPPPSLENQ